MDSLKARVDPKKSAKQPNRVLVALWQQLKPEQISTPARQAGGCSHLRMDTKWRTLSALGSSLATTLLSSVIGNKRYVSILWSSW